MFDTLVYYAYAKQYMTNQNTQWVDFMQWATSVGTKTQYVGKFEGLSG